MVMLPCILIESRHREGTQDRVKEASCVSTRLWRGGIQRCTMPRLPPLPGGEYNGGIGNGCMGESHLYKEGQQGVPVQQRHYWGQHQQRGERVTNDS